MGCIVNCFPECLVDTDLVDCWFSYCRVDVKVDASWTKNQNGMRHMTQRKCTSLSPGNQKSFIQVCCYIRLHSSHTKSLLLVYGYLWLIVVYRYDTNTPTLFVNCHPYSLLSPTLTLHLRLLPLIVVYYIAIPTHPPPQVVFGAHYSPVWSVYTI